MSYVHIGIIEKVDPHKNYGVIPPNKPYAEVVAEYHCIAVDDDTFDGWLGECNSYDGFHCTLHRPADFIDATGVTLLPPVSAEKFARFLEPKQVPDLVRLLRRATSEGKYVVIFGY